MREFIDSIALPVVITAPVLGIVTYLGRHLIDRWFNEGIERFRIETEATHKEHLQLLQHEQEVARIEHQARFARLHEKRAEILGTAYRLIIDADRSMRSWLSPIGDSQSPERDQARHHFQVASVELFRHLEENRIWLPATAADNVERYSQMLWDLDDRASTVDVSKRWREVKDDLIRTLPEMRKSIETEFRSLIDPPRSH